MNHIHKIKHGNGETAAIVMSQNNIFRRDNSNTKIISQPNKMTVSAIKKVLESEIKFTEIK